MGACPIASAGSCRWSPGMAALAASSLLFAYRDRLSWLFAARLVQGAADAVTWVVGFALIADLYGPDERGRVMGLVMSGSTFGFMIGPTLGGWLYEAGGIRLPFLFAGRRGGAPRPRLPLAAAARRRTACASRCRRARSCACRRSPSCALAVVVGGGTIAMLEPVLSLFLATELGLRPGADRPGVRDRRGRLDGPASGLRPLADRWGGRRLMLIGLIADRSVAAVLSFSRGLRVGGRRSTSSHGCRRVRWS